MIRLINRNTGGDMWVSESRLSEYLAAGHSLAASQDISDAVEPAEKPAPKRKARKPRKEAAAHG